MKFTSVLPGVFLFASALSGCGFTQDKNPSAGSGPTTTTTTTGSPTQTGVGTGTTATFSNVSSEILQPNCTSCHSGSSPSGGVDLSSYTGVMAVVTAGSPSSSNLYTAVNGGIMPPGGSLAQSDIALIDSWITAGALNN
jgi:uncharacterized membrane protein